MTVVGVGREDTGHTAGAGTAVAGLTEVEYLNGEIEKLENERNRLIMERADFARREMHLRMLLELVDGMLQDRMGGTSSAGNRTTCPGTQGVVASVNASGSAGIGVNGSANASASTEMAGASATEIQGLGEREYSDACYDYEEFFERTRYRIPKKELWNGRVTAYDNDMVIRFLDRGA